MVGSLQTFKVKYAEARAKEHPELAQVYADKIAGLKAAGEPGRAGQGGAGQRSSAFIVVCNSV